MMKKVAVMALILGATFGVGGAIAHPTNVPYATRGECERASAESAKQDRERLDELGIFPTIGAAQSTFHEDWRCEYDEEEEAWFIADYRGR
jgi:hypothetical protein